MQLAVIDKQQGVQSSGPEPAVLQSFVVTDEHMRKCEQARGIWKHAPQEH